MADVLEAAGLDKPALELLLPHAATSSAATVASAPAASVRLNRCKTGSDDEPRWCRRSHPHTPRPVDKPNPIVDRINGSYSRGPIRGGYWLHWRELRIGHDRTREGLVDTRPMTSSADPWVVKRLPDVGLEASHRAGSVRWSIPRRRGETPAAASGLKSWLPLFRIASVSGDQTHSVKRHLAVDPEGYDVQIRRFIPYYDDMLATGVELLAALAPAGGHVLDLGGGTGALSGAVLEGAAPLPRPADQDRASPRHPQHAQRCAGARPLCCMGRRRPLLPARRGAERAPRSGLRRGRVLLATRSVRDHLRVARKLIVPI